MKKTTLKLFTLCIMLCLTIVGVTACNMGGNNQTPPPAHTCIYNKQVTTDVYKKSDATCESKAQFYYSCECGEKGEETFEHGEVVECSYGEWTSNGNGTHTKTCVYDDSHIIIENCNGGTATCKEKAICKDCESEYGNTVFHSIINGKCEWCEKAESKGLEFVLINNGTEYEIKSIGSCTDKEVLIPSTYWGKPVTSIGHFAFENCESLKTIEIPNSVTSIGPRAFHFCNSLTSIVIPNSVTSIGHGAFGIITTIYCESESKPDGWSETWNNPYAGDTIACSVVWDCNNNDVADDGYIYTVVDGLKYGIKNGVATVVEQPNNITTANIRESITYKGNSYCVTSIGYFAFSGCESLEEIIIPNTVTSIEEMAFNSNYNFTSIKIPISVSKVDSSAFGFGCINLTIYCEVGSKPDGWGDYWKSENPCVWDCNNNDIADDGYIYTVIDGIRYALKDGVATIVGGRLKNIVSLSIKQSITYKGNSFTVTSIGDSAFENCESLKTIEIPNSVTSIGDYAFYSRRSLVSVNFGDNSQLISIGYEAFYGCESLKTIEIPNSVTIIGGESFSNCSSLTSITIGNGVTIIGNWAFAGCSSLASIVIPNSVTTIGAYAFVNCSSLTSIVIPNSVTTIGVATFNGCSSLTSVTFGSNSQLTSIGESAFYNCSLLTGIEIPNNVTSIGVCAFYGCESLASVNFGDNSQLTSIGGGAFSYCSSLETIIIPNSVIEIGGFAFEDCNLLTIYCKAESEPDSWNGYWNFSNRPIVWGYKAD